MLICGGIPSMAHWCFWFSPSPQLFCFVLFCFVFFLFCFFCLFLFAEVVLVYFISLFACYAVEWICNKFKEVVSLENNFSQSRALFSVLNHIIMGAGEFFFSFFFFFRKKDCQDLIFILQYLLIKEYCLTISKRRSFSSVFSNKCEPLLFYREVPKVTTPRK